MDALSRQAPDADRRDGPDGSDGCERRTTILVGHAHAKQRCGGPAAHPWMVRGRSHPLEQLDNHSRRTVRRLEQFQREFDLYAGFWHMHVSERVVPFAKRPCFQPAPLGSAFFGPQCLRHGIYVSCFSRSHAERAIPQFPSSKCSNPQQPISKRRTADRSRGRSQRQHAATQARSPRNIFLERYRGSGRKCYDRPVIFPGPAAERESRANSLTRGGIRRCRARQPRHSNFRWLRFHGSDRRRLYGSSGGSFSVGKQSGTGTAKCLHLGSSLLESIAHPVKRARTLYWKSVR